MNCPIPSPACTVLKALGAGVVIAQPCSATVRHTNSVVGEHFVDLLEDDTVPGELNTERAPDDAHRLRRVEDIKVTGLHLCLPANVTNPRLEVERVVNRR
jgi:hypothetical protein